MGMDSKEPVYHNTLFLILLVFFKHNTELVLIGREKRPSL